MQDINLLMELFFDSRGISSITLTKVDSRFVEFGELKTTTLYRITYFSLKRHGNWSEDITKELYEELSEALNKTYCNEKEQ